MTPDESHKRQTIYVAWVMGAACEFKTHDGGWIDEPRYRPDSAGERWFKDWALGNKSAFTYRIKPKD